MLPPDAASCVSMRCIRRLGLWVSSIFFVDGDRGTHVFIDHADGRVYEVSDLIVN